MWFLRQRLHLVCLFSDICILSVFISLVWYVSNNFRNSNMYQSCSHGDTLGQDVGTFQMCLTCQCTAPGCYSNSTSLSNGIDWNEIWFSWEKCSNAKGIYNAHGDFYCFLEKPQTLFNFNFCNLPPLKMAKLVFHFSKQWLSVKGSCIILREVFTPWTDNVFLLSVS